MVSGPRQNRYRLANQILEIVRDAHFEPGHRLREQQLGDMLGVSRTPVRAALSLLAERGIVEAKKNHGFLLTARPDELHRLEVEIPTTATQDLYTRIVEDRLSGHLTETFTQTQILQRYDVDRTLLLRTLTHLVSDGLLARNSGRGWTFQPTLDTQMALRNSYNFRRTIEPAGIMLDTFRSDAAALERSRLHHLYLEAHPDIRSLDPRQLFEADAQFHEMIAEFSGNVFFQQAIQQQNRLRRLLEFSGYTNRRRVRDWCHEHVMIIDAIASDDRALAAALMNEHLNAALASAPKYGGG